MAANGIKTLRKLKSLGYTAKQIEKATGIPGRTQRRILNEPGHKLSLKNRRKISALAPKYDDIKYRRSTKTGKPPKDINLKYFSNYSRFPAKIGQKEFEIVREKFDLAFYEFMPDVLSEFLKDNHPAGRFISVRIVFYNSEGSELFALSTENVDMSNKKEGLELLESKIINRIRQAEVNTQSMIIEYKPGQTVDPDEIPDDMEITSFEVELIGITKGL